MKIRDWLFRDFTGCSNHCCVVTGPKSGIGTNGICSCVVNMERSQLTLLQSKLRVLSEYDLPEEIETKIKAAQEVGDD